MMQGSRGSDLASNSRLRQRGILSSSTQEQGCTVIKGSMAPDAVRKVLGLLATNHDFREQMLGDPVSALKAQGVDVDPQAVPAVRKLPSMADCAQAQQQYAGESLDKVGLIFLLLR